MELEQAADTFASVAAWRAGLREQWGGDPLAEEPHKLASLERFCAFAGQTPDALVAFCLLRKRDSGERFASVVRRAELAEKLRAFLAASGLAGTAARQASSDVLSFLIHNGVMMNPGCARPAPAPAGQVA
jgi:hypothetical protein